MNATTNRRLLRQLTRRLSLPLAQIGGGMPGWHAISIARTVLARSDSPRMARMTCAVLCRQLWGVVAAGRAPLAVAA